ncbi:hypothetical protein D3C71_1328260 [compost metagenome]
MDINENNEVIFKDLIDNKTLMVLDKPFLIDANGVENHNVVYSLSNDGEFDTLIVEIKDENYMINSTYPVVLDPTVIVIDQTGARSYFQGANNGQEIGSNNLSGGYWGALTYKAFDDIRQEYINRSSTLMINKFDLELYMTQGADKDVRWGTAGTSIYTLINPWNVGSAPINSGGVKVGDYSSLLAKNWIKVNLKNSLSSNFYGLRFTPAGSLTWAYFASPFNSNISLRPKLTIQYFYKPILGFHDGNADTGGYYSDGIGNTFKDFNLGNIIAGQTSIAQKVYLRNLSGFDVKNLRIKVDIPNPSPEISIEISKTQSPFVPELELSFTFGAVLDNSDVSFYARIVTGENANDSGIVKFLANAEQV